MSDFDLEYGVRIANVDGALRDVGRVEAANQNAARSTQQAAAQTQRAAAASSQAIQQLGQRAGQTGTALGQMGSILGGLAGQGTAAGQAISQLGGAVGALSGAMGPLGVALGVVTLAVTAVNLALNHEANSHREAAEAASAQTAALRGLAQAAREARAATSQQADIAGGQLGSISGNDLQQQAEERRQRVLQLEGRRSERLSGFGLVERDGQVFRRNAFGEVEASLPVGFENGEGSSAEIARLRAEVDQLDNELRSREQVAADGQREAQASSIAAGVRSETALAERNAPRRSGGGGGSPRDTFRGDGGAALRGLISDADAGGADALAYARALGEGADELLAKADERDEAEKRRLQERLESQRELAQAAVDASRTFEDSWTGSLDNVIDAWQDANRALRSSGGQMLSQGELLRVGMVSVGNEIADTIGGTMVGAFEQALGAWLDGSKSFVEAAEDMVKGVLKALVIESIVQAVTETARGIADIASYRYDSGALHFAAAAAWAAVGGVAGAVGAGIGAFGGGGSKGEGATAAASPTDASTTAQAQQPAPIFNIYPGGYITRRDVAAGLFDALEEAAREGHRLDPSIIGG